MKNKSLNLILSLAAILFLYEIYVVLYLWTPVGYVDTWPLYQRFEKLSSGEMGILRLILEPHVHPHSIVFLIYLFDYWLFDLRQIVPTIFSIGSTVGASILLVYLLFRVNKYATNDRVLLLSFIISASLLLALPTGESIIPFQTVVLTSRFLYMVVLLYVIKAVYENNEREWYKAILLASFSMTFYASAGVIGALIVCVSVVSMSGWRRIGLSFVPLLVYFSHIKFFYTASVEGPVVAGLIKNINFELVKNIILGGCAYIATPLNAAFRGLNIDIYISFGAAILILTVLVSIVMLRELLLKKEEMLARNIVLLFVLCINVWVVFSAFSTSLLWQARVKIPGFEGFDFLTTIVSSMRYAVFASLLIAMLPLSLCFISLPKKLTRSVSISIAGVTFLIVLGALAPQRISEEREHIDQINRSATAVLMDVNFSNKIASSVWPGNTADSYWAQVFDKINKFMVQNRLGYASKTYKLNSLIDSRARGIPVVNAKVTELVDLKICSLDAKASKVSSDFFFPQVIMMIMNEKRMVVGYAIQDDEKILGYFQCGNALDLLQIVDYGAL